MSDPSRSWFDHAPAVVVTFLLGGYGLIGVTGLLLSPGGHGMSGLALFPCVAALYAAAAVLQWEFQFVHGWEPGVKQGAAVMWIGAWTFVVLAGTARTFAADGVAAAGAFFGGAAFFWCLFVGLPWLLAFFRHAGRREDSRGFIHDSREPGRGDDA